MTGDEVVAEYGAIVSRANSEGLMSACEHLLWEAGWDIADLDAVAVAIGPGSYTGVRIGVTMAKALGYALGIPIGAVNTLDAIAANVPFSDRLVRPLICARRDLVYTALYRARGLCPERVTDYEAKSIRDVLGDSAGHDSDGPGRARIVFLGDGAVAHRHAITASMGERAAIGPAWCLGPRSAVVALMGMGRIASGEAEDAETLVPFYLGRSSAKMSEDRPRSDEEACTR